ncbi:MAG: hypothetical protein DIU79_11690 [Actinobacteria bacterium]|nr:MAG: hypothetical protein DIU79_11690 [Actinomycetota bacterium]
MLPEDYRSSWLSDYESIEADISKMEDFAAKLTAEVRDNYGPHAESLFEDMTTELPSPHAAFQELTAFLVAHNVIEQDTADVVYYYQGETDAFAIAADEIAQRYKDTDAFSAARVSDVTKAFENVYSPEVSSTTLPTADSSSSPAERTVPDPTITPEVH